MNKHHAAWMLALSSATFAAPAVAASEAELSARLDRLAAELDSVKAELRQVKAQQAVAATALTTAATTASASSAAPAEPATTLFGYGEINYNRPRNNSSDASIDVRRAVLGIGHRFDDKTRMAMELEVEHAVASADDRGEVEIEQLYIDHQLTPDIGLQAGLFLIPAGLLNRNHEPTAYYGVERNFVETAIIPTTWREAGVALRGNTDSGLGWSAGLTSGFDLTKWDATSSEGRESPLGSVHQEGQLAKAHDVSTYGLLEYTGMPGLLLGAFAFTGKAGHDTAGFAAPAARVTLWDAHARWTPGKWDLSALYAKGTISGTGALNLTLVGSATPVPKEFFGWYVQGAYQAWTNGSATLSPFARYERFNTASRYEDLPAGLSVAPTADERVATVGVNYKLNPNVVFKADYQKFKLDTARDRVNVGMGYSF